jgi:hypothetical protein
VTLTVTPQPPSATWQVQQLDEVTEALQAKLDDGHTTTTDSATSSRAPAGESHGGEPAAEPTAAGTAVGTAAGTAAGAASGTAAGYELYQQIGRGASGTVFHALDRCTGLDVAIKVLAATNARGAFALTATECARQREEAHSEVVREVALLAACDSPYGAWPIDRTRDLSIRADALLTVRVRSSVFEQW